MILETLITNKTISRQALKHTFTSNVIKLCYSLQNSNIIYDNWHQHMATHTFICVLALKYLIYVYINCQRCELSAIYLLITRNNYILLALVALQGSVNLIVAVGITTLRTIIIFMEQKVKCVLIKINIGIVILLQWARKADRNYFNSIPIYKHLMIKIKRFERVTSSSRSWQVNTWYQGYRVK